MNYSPSRDPRGRALGMARVAASAVALSVALALPGIALRSQPPGARIQAGSVVRPDTVEVGDPFVLTVSVAVPEGARVEWGAITDSAAWVAMRGAVKVVDEGDKLGVHRERAEYVLTAWNIGTLPLGVPDAIVHVGSVATPIPLASARIFVRSVLPADTSLRVPKPARDLFQREVPWWQRWWPVLLVLLALGALWWYVRRRRRRSVANAVPVPVDPYQRALHEFARLDQLQLAEAGECGRYVALSTDILRLYLAARLPNAVLSLTSAELLLVALEDERVPSDRLVSLLADADGVKFAARTVTPARAHALANDARNVVMEIERAEQARRADELAAQQAAADAAARERIASEEEARRSSRQPRQGAGSR